MDTLIKSTRKCIFAHVQIRTGWINPNQILHINFLGGHSDIIETISTLVQGAGGCEI